jgi:hypothetical protein
LGYFIKDVRTGFPVEGSQVFGGEGIE